MVAQRAFVLALALLVSKAEAQVKATDHWLACMYECSLLHHNEDRGFCKYGMTCPAGSDDEVKKALKCKSRLPDWRDRPPEVPESHDEIPFASIQECKLYVKDMTNTGGYQRRMAWKSAFLFMTGSGHRRRQLLPGLPGDTRHDGLLLLRAVAATLLNGTAAASQQLDEGLHLALLADDRRTVDLIANASREHGDAAVRASLHRRLQQASLFATWFRKNLVSIKWVLLTKGCIEPPTRHELAIGSTGNCGGSGGWECIPAVQDADQCVEKFLFASELIGRPVG